MRLLHRLISLIISAGGIFFLSCQKELSCEDCYTAPNTPPVAHAGKDSIIFYPSDSAFLDGGGSIDLDGLIETYEWKKISGAINSIIVSASTARSMIKNLIPGIYEYELTVKDNGGKSARDTVRVTVQNTAQLNSAPVARAGADQTVDLPLNVVTLDGSSSFDVDNNITGYLWTKLSGPVSSNILSAQSVRTMVHNLVEGRYKFELKLIDAGGLSAKDTVTIDVLPAISGVYAADAGPDIILTLPLDSVYLDGKFGGPVNTPFEWEKISGPSGGEISIANMLYPGIAITRHLQPGVYTFKFSLTGSQASSDTMTVTVINDPQDRNTITFKSLKWRMADEYGIGNMDLDVVPPSQPNLFLAWNQMRPADVFLKPDPSSPWILLPFSDPFNLFTFDSTSPRLWIMRLPVDAAWVGKLSDVKVKIL